MESEIIRQLSMTGVPIEDYRLIPAIGKAAEQIKNMNIAHGVFLSDEQAINKIVQTFIPKISGVVKTAKDIL